jgi:hypothetical protein
MDLTIALLIGLALGVILSRWLPSAAKQTREAVYDAGREWRQARIEGSASDIDLAADRLMATVGSAEAVDGGDRTAMW